MNPQRPRYSDAFNQPPPLAPIDLEDEKGRRLVRAGWACVLASLFLGFCGAFCFAAIICGIIAITKDKVGEGAAIIIVAPVATAINFVIVYVLILVPFGFWTANEMTRNLRP